MSASTVEKSAPAGRNTGTLLVAGIFVVALLAAGASWWFRFAATHRAVQFWGPEAAGLIRDAPVVELIVRADDTLLITDNRDISHARGLVHLRNALLEDHSFAWPPRDDVPDANWEWALAFSDPSRAAKVMIRFSSDCRLASRVVLDPGPSTGADDQSARAISCEPIADGLRTFLAELTEDHDAPAR
jgi:hypothetical protein